MSKNITIQENGASKQLTVDKLNTPEAGDWIPEDTAQVDDIIIKGNGTVTASDSKVFGFDKVTVNVTKGSSGSALAGKPHTGEITPVSPSIKEGGIARVMGFIKKLKIRSVLWIPEKSAKLGTLKVTANGTYSAASEGLYGYSSVTVNVDTSQGGGGTGGGTGGGEVVDKLAAYIEVTTPPNVTTYAQGAYIEFDGLVVTAYDVNGNSMGEVPFNELIFPVTVARYDANAEFVPGSAQSDLDLSPVEQPIQISNGNTYTVTRPDSQWTFVYEETELVDTFYYVTTDNNLHVLCASTERGQKNILHENIYRNGVYISDSNYSISISNSFIVDEKRVYWGTFGHFKDSWSTTSGLSVTPYIGDLSNVILGKIAWTMIYGTVTSGGNQQIPVQWSRPGDNYILETSFPITVTPSYGGAEGGGGTAGEGGAGRND